MNYPNPILICDENENFRSLLRDMLTKNGFFHVIEAAKADEALSLMKQSKDFLVLITAHQFSSELIDSLQTQKSFLVFAEGKDTNTLTLAARLGVNHIISYPFHSQKLIEKIHSML